MTTADLDSDVMLAVESCDEYICYRIQKRSKRIVRVEIHDPEIIPEAHRNYGPDAVVELGRLSVWDDSDWSTLQVHKEENGDIRCVKDDPPFHGVPKDYLLLDQYPICDISSLTIVRKVKQRTYEVSYNGDVCFLKVAQFPHELRWTIQEIKAYHILSGSSLIPKLLCYVSETPSLDCIAALLIEKIDGYTAGPDDLEPCLKAVDELHHYIVHGDLCKYNIIITAEGPKFIDLEDSTIAPENDGGQDLEMMKMKEREGLAAELADDSGRGRPYTIM